MADTKISALAALTASNASLANDYFPVIDASEADADKNKRMLLDELRKLLLPQQRCCVRLNTSITGVNYSTATAVAFDTLIEQTESGMWTLGDPTKVYIPSAWGTCKVRCFGQGSIVNVADQSSFSCRIFKNGAAFDPVATSRSYLGQAGSPVQPVWSTIQTVIGGTDYITLTLESSDASIDIANGTLLEVVRVG